MTSDDYARWVIDLYRSLPGGTGRTGGADWALARALYSNAIGPETVEAALLLGCARRAARDPALPPLPLIRSLAYFRSLIEELARQPLPPGYLEHLREHSQPPPTLPPARGRKPALLDDR